MVGRMHPSLITVVAAVGLFEFASGQTCTGNDFSIQYEGVPVFTVSSVNNTCMCTSYFSQGSSVVNGAFSARGTSSHVGPATFSSVVTLDSAAGSFLQFSNVLGKKISLYDSNQDGGSSYRYYGLGISSAQLDYMLPGTGNAHVFYAATSPTTRNELLRLSSNSNPALNTATVTGNLVVSGMLTAASITPSTPITGAVPIGSVVAWHKSMSGTPALPTGWLECNGQVVSDAASPYNGQAVPNLNGGNGNRFLRGAASSGAMGGSETHTHDFGQTGADMAPDASHYTDGSYTYASNHVPPFMNVVYIIRVK